MSGRGSVEKRGKAWRVRYSNGTNPDGTRNIIRRTFPTKREAERFVAELIVDAGNDDLEGRHFTLDQTIGHYLNVTDHAPTYRYDLERAHKLIPDPYLDTPIGRLRPADLRRLYDHLKTSGRSPWRIYRVHELIRSALTVAVNYEWVDRNVANAATPTKPRRKTPTPPTSAQLAALLAAADNDLLLWLKLSATTGARRGEIAGLQWADHHDHTLRIRRAVSYAPGTGIIIGPTKTGDDRRIAIGPLINHALDVARLEQQDRCNLAGIEWEPDRYVIATDPFGRRPWRPDRATNAVRNLRAKHPELTGVRLKELRHYVATRALTDGDDVRTVAGRLGHRQASTTLDVYATFVPEADRTLADRLDR